MTIKYIVPILRMIMRSFASQENFFPETFNYDLIRSINRKSVRKYSLFSFVITLTVLVFLCVIENLEHFLFHGSVFVSDNLVTIWYVLQHTNIWNT